MCTHSSTRENKKYKVYNALLPATTTHDSQRGHYDRRGFLDGMRAADMWSDTKSNAFICSLSVDACLVSFAAGSPEKSNPSEYPCPPPPITPTPPPIGLCNPLAP
eukprot:TRINITY_DN692_c0_g1_i1.p1 TRINITY_DN692_c0_g1~~TRINITY_DN692_c0_g1_i1.p1  ORF type:complete len:105 (+),score=4.23 TRINITY_DN692_c0_g1_i1:573-887(+)